MIIRNVSTSLMAAMVAVFLVMGVHFQFQKKHPSQNRIPKRDRMDLAMQYEFDITRDPATLKVPREKIMGRFTLC
jgi:hypothetical protein